MIKVENLTKKFGQIEAVKSVSFTVESGETLGLLGPNGAGKTTIMRLMTGYLPPTDGKVIINDLDMFDQPDEVKTAGTPASLPRYDCSGISELCGTDPGPDGKDAS
jgi:ABC-type multidrug transport system ATPase subunit